MLRHPVIAGLVMLVLTAGVLVLFISSLVVLGLVDTEIVPAWVLLLFFGFTAIAAWFFLGRALPAGFGSNFLASCRLSAWCRFCCGRSISLCCLPMAATAGPITVGLGYISRKEE